MVGAPAAHCPSAVPPAPDRLLHSDAVMQTPVRPLLALGVQESCLKVTMLKRPKSPWEEELIYYLVTAKYSTGVRL